LPRIAREEGRRLFGSDAAAYELARPGHAERVYEVLVERCGLAAGTRVLEIGPGTGQATRLLLELGAEPLVVVEPDPQLAAFLRETLRTRIELHETALEEAELPASAFHLAAAASSFHWIDEDVGLARIFSALLPDGWFAMWWTLFGERSKPDAFITATTPLLEDLASSPTAGEAGRPPHALDREARVAALENAGFEEIEHELVRWNASWDTDRIRALYGTFSPIARLDEPRRTEILDEIARIAREDFGGRVERALVTSLYTAQRSTSAR
jgi:SAM-dependent methyltransferase